MCLMQPPTVSAFWQDGMASRHAHLAQARRVREGTREASRLDVAASQGLWPGFATDENVYEPSSSAHVDTMLRRGSALLQRACSQAIASSCSAQGTLCSATEHLNASYQRADGRLVSSSDSWPTFASAAASAGSRAYSSGPNVSLGGDSFEHAGSSSSSSSRSSGSGGSGAPDVDAPGVLDADAISSAAALAESDALLQATEAAWYPTIGVQKLVELVHDQGNLPWCASPALQAGLVEARLVSLGPQTTIKTACRSTQISLTSWY